MEEHDLVSIKSPSLEIAVSSSMLHPRLEDYNSNNNSENYSMDYFDVDEGKEPINIIKTFHTATSKQPEEKFSNLTKQKMKTNLTVLFADDFDMNRLVMKANLSKYENIKLICVENGLEALKYYESASENIDIILMDSNMPIMDGYEAVEKIRKINIKRGSRRVPIIAISAFLTQTDIDRLFAVGIDDYITSPIRREVLKEKIDKLVNI